MKWIKPSFPLPKANADVAVFEEQNASSVGIVTRNLCSTDTAQPVQFQYLGLIISDTDTDTKMA